MVLLHFAQDAKQFNPTNQHRTTMYNAEQELMHPGFKQRQERSGGLEQFCGEMPRNLQCLRVKKEEGEKVSEKLFPRVNMFEEIALNQGLQSLRGTR